MRITTPLALLLTSALLLTACSSVPLDQKPPIEDRSGNQGTSRDVSTVTAGTGSSDALNDPKGILAKRSIYFDLDSYTVKDEFKPVVEAHARYLTNNKARKIVIQGNTDERGGREYNLA